MHGTREAGIRRWLRIFLALAGLLAALAIAYETHTPATVPWEPALIQGFAAERATGLVLQQVSGDDVWASRGWSIYRSRAGDRFARVFKLRPRFGEAWGGYSRSLRRIFGYQELVEVVPLNSDVLLVFGGGDVWRISLSQETQEHVHKLRYFGRNKGRGVMPHGVAVTPSGDVYYGEYPTNLDGELDTVRIWHGQDQGRRWRVAHEFNPGEVRHIHNVQWDPYAGSLWVGTGDSDSRSMVGRSDDGGRRFQWIGRGSQLFRVASLLFFAGEVAWGTDADRSQNRYLRWHRADDRVEATDTMLPGPSFYAQSLGPAMGLLGIAELDASLWVSRAGREPRRLLQWTIPPRPLRGPHPGVRLARGDGLVPEEGRFALANPLRTVEDEATIWRLPIRSVFLSVQGDSGESYIPKE